MILYENLYTAFPGGRKAESIEGGSLAPSQTDLATGSDADLSLHAYMEQAGASEARISLYAAHVKFMWWPLSPCGKRLNPSLGLVSNLNQTDTTQLRLLYPKVRRIRAKLAPSTIGVAVGHNLTAEVSYERHSDGTFSRLRLEIWTHSHELDFAALASGILAPGRKKMRLQGLTLHHERPNQWDWNEADASKLVALLLEDGFPIEGMLNPLDMRYLSILGVPLPRKDILKLLTTFSELRGLAIRLGEDTNNSQIVKDIAGCCLTLRYLHIRVGWVVESSGDIVDKWMPMVELCCAQMLHLRELRLPYPEGVGVKASELDMRGLTDLIPATSSLTLLGWDAPSTYKPGSGSVWAIDLVYESLKLVGTGCQLEFNVWKGDRVGVDSMSAVASRFDEARTRVLSWRDQLEEAGMSAHNAKGWSRIKAEGE